MKIDRAPGRREFADSDRESDLSDEVEIVQRRHNRRLKARKIIVSSMNHNQIEEDKRKPKICGLTFEEILRV